ncbi:succinate dehydrogenase, hydrophobic membrane anchor protein [Caldichromatium japonicum]|uniref:Succinate dehydrogenase hydrophobic membrane anchor subunit n=1 Tax=Caldichromatium japonicum TaxID=2699430 RepID=A0A6G7VEG7_9GAMM|nr:succinate dehydrogenase, hydrophobic membrane anchor protein [Caldichromatium japonicum]QIK38187.1 succinate dehydrogenase, hydrophobic membrane anchor protein [Caldichromatium japonicum]
MSRQAGGLAAWLIQRASALYLIPWAVWLMLTLTLDPPCDHAALIAWIRAPGVMLAWLLALPALLAHAWIGARDVLIDYVRPLALRLTLLWCLALTLIGSGLWLLKSLFAVAGG